MTRPRVPHPTLMTSQPRTSSTEECRQRASVGRAPLVQNQRSLVKMTGFPQNTLRVSRVLRDQPHSRESADLMHWFMHWFMQFMHRFPPLRQFTFAHGGNRPPKARDSHSRQLPPSNRRGRCALRVRSSSPAGEVLARLVGSSRPREIIDGFSSCPAQPPRVATSTYPPSGPLLFFLPTSSPFRLF